MKKFNRFFILFIVSLISKGFLLAQNLVPNGSFEQAYNPPTTASDDFGSDVLWWNLAQYNGDDCWEFHLWGHPCGAADYASPTTDNVKNCFSYTYPSNRFVGLKSGTANRICHHTIGVRVPLRKNGQTYSLIKGQTYTLRLKLRVLGKKNRFRVHFAKHSTNWNENPNNGTNRRWTNVLMLDLEGKNYDKCTWYQFATTFTVPQQKCDGNGGCDYLQNMILFLEDNNSSEINGELYIDDVELYEGGCNEDLRVEDKTYTTYENPYEFKHIYVGYDAGIPNEAGNVTVSSTANVTYKALEEVALLSGFGVEAGGVFHAFIAPCGKDCFPPTVNAGQDVTVCGTTAQLGAAPEDNITYSWTANPASAIAHLSSTTVANPVFSPVAGVPGSNLITYTVTATNECGESVTDNVTVLYEPAPNNSPTVNVSNVVYSDMIEFDAAFSNHTEQLFIEVTTSTGTPVANYTYHLGTDFTCCSYHWKIPVALSPCNDYTVKVYTKNLCSNVLSSPVILNWVRNRNVSFTYVSNVITNNSPNWCFGFTGAVQYELFITSAGGAPVYNGSGSITPPQACIWSGQCNQQCLSSTVKDGTYYYVLTIKGCDGKSVTQTGFIMVMINKRSEASVDENDTTAAVADNAIFGIEAFPNPSSGIVNLQINGLQNSLSKNKVQAYNSLGSVVYTTESNNRQLEIDLSNQAQGIYNIKVETEYGIKTTKIIYTK